LEVGQNGGAVGVVDEGENESAERGDKEEDQQGSRRGEVVVRMAVTIYFMRIVIGCE